MKNIVEVKDLSINFKVRDGSFRAVDKISFERESLLLISRYVKINDILY